MCVLISLFSVCRFTGWTQPSNTDDRMMMMQDGHKWILLILGLAINKCLENDTLRFLTFKIEFMSKKLTSLSSETVVYITHCVSGAVCMGAYLGVGPFQLSRQNGCMGT